MLNASAYNIDTLIDATKHLVSFPRVVLSLLQTLNDDYTDLHHIAALIKQDPALTTDLIRLCNSPMYYSSGEPVYSVEEAIKLVGTEQIVTLSLALCACNATSGLNNEVIELSDYWYHCLMTACISSVLARDIPKVSNGAAFTGGLLHDIGQLPLFYQYPVESIEVLNSCQIQTDQQIVLAEKAIFGFTHEDVGGRLAQKWGFPEALAKCLSQHHRCNLDTTQDQLAMIVHVGNLLSDAFETQEDPESYLQSVNQSILTCILPDVQEVHDVLEKASEYFNDVQSSILV